MLKLKLADKFIAVFHFHYRIWLTVIVFIETVCEIRNILTVHAKPYGTLVFRKFDRVFGYSKDSPALLSARVPDSEPYIVIGAFVYWIGNIYLCGVNC